MRGYRHRMAPGYTLPPVQRVARCAGAAAKLSHEQRFIKAPLGLSVLAGLAARHATTSPPAPSPLARQHPPRIQPAARQRALHIGRSTVSRQHLRAPSSSVGQVLSAQIAGDRPGEVTRGTGRTCRSREGRKSTARVVHRLGQVLAGRAGGPSVRAHGHALQSGAALPSPKIRAGRTARTRAHPAPPAGSTCGAAPGLHLTHQPAKRQLRGRDQHQLRQSSVRQRAHRRNQGGTAGETARQEGMSTVGAARTSPAPASGSLVGGSAMGKTPRCRTPLERPTHLHATARLPAPPGRKRPVARTGRPETRPPRSPPSPERALSGQGATHQLPANNGSGLELLRRHRGGYRRCRLSAPCWEC